MNCSDCPQENNHRYIYGRKNLTFGGALTPQALALFDQKLKDRTQCQCIARYSLDNKEVIVECCRPTKLTVADTVGWGLDDFADWSRAEAKAYIQTNVANWEKWENPPP